MVLKINKIALYCTILFLLLVISLFLPVISYVLLLIGLFMFIKTDIKGIFCILLFMFPFATLFKASLESTSFFTIMEIAAIILIQLKMKKRNGILLFIMMLIVVSCMSGTINILSMLKIMIIFALYYIFTQIYRYENAKEYFSFFIAGILSSTALSLFREEIPRILQYQQELNYVWNNGVRTLRFSGIFSDPNYFSIPIMLGVTICAISVFEKNKKNVQSGILFILLSVFGFATLSKSFILVYIVVLLAISYKVDKKSKHVKIFGVFFLLFIFMVTDPFGLISALVGRFNNVDITTGRLEIWSSYWSKITENIGNLVFGWGLGAPNIMGNAAHCMWLEMMYYIGLLGLVTYVFNIIYMTYANRRRFQRNILNYLGFATVFIQYTFLCGLTAYEVPFYLIIAYLLFNNDFNRGQSIL